MQNATVASLAAKVSLAALATGIVTSSATTVSASVISAFTCFDGHVYLNAAQCPVEATPPANIFSGGLPVLWIVLASVGGVLVLGGLIWWQCARHARAEAAAEAAELQLSEARAAKRASMAGARASVWAGSGLGLMMEDGNPSRRASVATQPAPGSGGARLSVAAAPRSSVMASAAAGGAPQPRRRSVLQMVGNELIDVEVVEDTPVDPGRRPSAAAAAAPPAARNSAFVEAALAARRSSAAMAASGGVRRSIILPDLAAMPEDPDDDDDVNHARPDEPAVDLPVSGYADALSAVSRDEHVH